MALLIRLRTWWRNLRRPLDLGRRGERVAERHLKRLGYKIVGRSDKAKLGEIDLVAVDGRTVVFVEVKTRTSQDAGHPADAVDLRKQQRLTRAALGYLKRHNLLEGASRFDVVAVTWGNPRKPPVVEHFRHAFEATQ